MPRDPRYDVLFKPVKIRPVTARNRFGQVPHCNGTGRTCPSSKADKRRVKADGGWAVICTEEVEIHPFADHSPRAGGRRMVLTDIPDLRRWHVTAAKRAQTVGVEVALVCAGHQLSTISHVLSRHRNRRTDAWADRWKTGPGCRAGRSDETRPGGCGRDGGLGPGMRRPLRSGWCVVADDDGRGA